MSDAIERDELADAPSEDEPEDSIRGAFVLAMVFLVMVVLLFFWTYGVLLDRAG